MQLIDCLSVAHINGLASRYPWSVAQFEESVESHNAFVIEVNSEIAGFSVFQTILDEACLLNVAIHPQYQRRGYAHALITNGFLGASKQGAKHCYLEVRESNVSAIALYSKLGFEQTGLRKNYYPLASQERQGREHAVIMSKAL